jgi:sulfur-carrier protein adenylyltransferase/sulfurtransferase
MLTDVERSRYSKQIILPEIGDEGQLRLKQAKVLVIGAGGLGCPILQYLTAAGIGAIGIADGDVIQLSNLQRQVLYSEQEIGLRKADVAAKKLQLLNPHVQFNLYPVFIDSSNVLDILREYDVVVDGSDNFDTRYLVNDACVMLDKPMVFGAIYRFEGHVSVFNYKSGPTYRCVFPDVPGEGESPNCADIGVVATLPGIVGTIQANEVIKVITGIGEVLSGRLLVIDTLTMNMHSFGFKLNEANRMISTLQESNSSCNATYIDVNYDQFHAIAESQPGAQIVDVREYEEHEMGNIGGVNIPLSVFETGLDKINKQAPVLLYCSSGVRSRHAAKMLIEIGFMKVYNLKNGINDIKVS